MSETSKPDIDAFNPGWRLNAAWSSIAIVNLACALDATTVSVALPVMSAAIQSTSIESLWIGTAFLLASCVWQPVFIAGSNDFGRRPILIFALVLFTLGAILCGVSKILTVMLVGRVIQGSGVGGILASSRALVTDLIPLRHRGNYFATMSMVWALGTITVTIGFIGVIAFLHLEHKVRSLKEIVAEFDWIGSTIFVASTTSFLVPLSCGGIMYPWKSWRTHIPSIVGICGWIAFAFYEEIVAKHPLIPIRIFRNRTTLITYMQDALQGIIMFSAAYYLPLYFMGVHLYTPIEAGLTSLPQTLTVVPSAGVVGVIASEIEHYRWSLWAGWTLTTLGCGIMYLLDVHTKTVQWIFMVMISGIGTGLLFPGLSLSVQASVGNRDLVAAAGMTTLFRQLGQGLGVAIGGVIFQNRLKTELAPQFASYATDAVALISQMHALPSNSTDTLLLKIAFANSIRTVWASMCGVAGLALMLSLFLKGCDLNQTYKTDQGFAGDKRTAAVIDVEAEVVGTAGSDGMVSGDGEKV